VYTLNRASFCAAAMMPETRNADTYNLITSGWNNVSRSSEFHLTGNVKMGTASTYSTDSIIRKGNSRNVDKSAGQAEK
jgi:hypothetical protein